MKLVWLAGRLGLRKIPHLARDIYLGQREEALELKAVQESVISRTASRGVEEDLHKRKPIYPVTHMAH